MIEADRFTAGDGLITRDTATGLDWLDLTESEGFSFAQIQAGAGGFAAEGWQHATTAEVCALFENHATAPVPCPSDNWASGSPGANDLLIGLLGVTGSLVFGGDVSEGLFDDTDAGIDASLVGVARLSGMSDLTDAGSYVHVDDCDATSDSCYFSTVGNFLVRPIVPSLEIEMDIKPGSDANPINPFGKGVIPVALLGSDSFDVDDVDVTTLAFGPAMVSPAFDLRLPFVYLLSRLWDVNEDGEGDLTSQYRVQETGIAVGDTEACLTGETLDGTSFKGCDAITTAFGCCGHGFEAALVVPPLVWIGGRMRRRRR